MEAEPLAASQSPAKPDRRRRNQLNENGLVETGVYVVDDPISNDPKDGVWRMKAMHVAGYWVTVRDRDNPNGPVKVSDGRYKIVRHIKTSLLTLEHFQGLSKDRQVTLGSLDKPTRPKRANLAPCHFIQVMLLKRKLRSGYFADEAMARNGGAPLEPWTPPPRRPRRNANACAARPAGGDLPVLRPEVACPPKPVSEPLKGRGVGHS